MLRLYVNGWLISFATAANTTTAAADTDAADAAAAAAEYTMRNGQTGDLSLIIRFKFYAFQMINVEYVSSHSIALFLYPLQSALANKRMAQNLSCELFECMYMRMDKHVESITVNSL